MQAPATASEPFDFASGGLPGEELHRLLAGLRRQAPVVPVRFAGAPAWLITRHATLAAAFREPELFPPGRAYVLTTEPAVGRSFISMDGDEHRIYRTLATPAFRPRAVAAFDDRALIALANELVDAFEGESEIDLVPRFAQRFALLVICRLLGIPRDAEDRFQRWALGLLIFPFDPALARSCSEEFTRFLLPLVAEPRRAPRADVISELLAAEVEGRKLENEEVLSHVRLLFPTGAETTANALGSLVYALLSEPGLWRRVREHPEECAWAVEELLRWESPVAIVPRVSASAPIEFAGTEIRADSAVLFCVAAANRDPGVYADPERCDLDRRPDSLVTFGPGPRQCPGMHLARKELRIALGVLCERLPQLRLLDAQASRPAGSVLRSPPCLRVALR